MQHPPIEKVQKFIIGNWKMYLGYKQSIDLAYELEKRINFVGPDLRVVICPSYPTLPAIRPMLNDIFLGSQDASISDSYGAFTSQVCPKMLKEIGCTYVILGHSEKREFDKETDETINKKVKKVLSQNLVPILCVGERREERDGGNAEQVVMTQLEACLKDVTLVGSQHLIIAYEPVWAIGTGQACTPEKAVEMHKLIAHFLKEKFSNYQIKKRVWIIYGGSVKGDNFMSFCNHPEIEGALIGGASVKPNEFVTIVETVKKELFLND